MVRRTRTGYVHILARLPPEFKNSRARPLPRPARAPLSFFRAGLQKFRSRSRHIARATKIAAVAKPADATALGADWEPVDPGPVRVRVPPAALSVYIKPL